LGSYSRHEQIDVPENSTTRLVENEIAQGLVARDEARLLPQGFARRGRDATDDHVADLALGVAGNDVDDLEDRIVSMARPIEETIDEQLYQLRRRSGVPATFWFTE
jgi:hypothetical protein